MSTKERKRKTRRGIWLRIPPDLYRQVIEQGITEESPDKAIRNGKETGEAFGVVRSYAIAEPTTETVTTWKDQDKPTVPERTS